MAKDYPQPHKAVGPPYVGQWGILSYFVPAELMPEEDVRRYLQERRGEDFFCCVREELPFVVVRNTLGQEYRVDPRRFIWVERPRFEVGESVRANVGSRRVGWIAVRAWHRKHRRVYYQLEVLRNGVRKLHSRWYWEEELDAEAPRD